MKLCNITLAAALCACMAACSTSSSEQAGQIRLKGQLIDMGSTEVPMRYDGAASEVGDSRDILLRTDDQGRFDTILTLTEPAYYSISRNTLYLTPGDDLTVKITTNNQEAEFSGKGAAVNEYMKYRLFPKGGSFLESGSNVRADWPSTKTLIDSLAAVRRHQLDTLGDASEAFKELEGARITADVANSCLSYVGYSGMLRGVKSREEAMKMIEDFYVSVTPDMKPYFTQLAQDKFLDVAVVRDVLSYIVSPDGASAQAWAESVTLTPRIQELYGAADQAGKMRSRVDAEVLAQIKAFADSLQSRDFAAELKIKIEQASKLLKGQPAIDFGFVDMEGNAHRLSDFKGKVLYVDFWATWCGPCINESPYFEKLSKEYAGKDIVFIAMSTDTNKEAWKAFVIGHEKPQPQYNTVDTALDKGWAIFYIPRFVVIDKDFNIVDAYAPRPSEPEAKALLDSLLP